MKMLKQLISFVLTLNSIGYGCVYYFHIHQSRPFFQVENIKPGTVNNISGFKDFAPVSLNLGQARDAGAWRNALPGIYLLNFYTGLYEIPYAALAPLHSCVLKIH